MRFTHRRRCRPWSRSRPVPGTLRHRRRLLARRLAYFVSADESDAEQNHHNKKYSKKLLVAEQDLRFALTSPQH